MLNESTAARAFTSSQKREAAKSGLHRIPLAATVLLCATRVGGVAPRSAVDQVHPTEIEGP